MGTNKHVDFVETSVGKQLRIKTESQALPPDQQIKLVSALELARDMLDFACNSLTFLWQQPAPRGGGVVTQRTTEAYSDTQRAILAKHFAMDHIPSFKRAELARRFADLNGELNKDITIADARSSIYTIEIRSAADKTLRDWEELLQEADDAQSELKRNPSLESFNRDESVRARIDAWEAARGTRAQQFAKDVRFKRENLQGFLRPHKPYAGLRTKSNMSDVRAPELEARQYGSIHLNFALLLAPNTSVMKVAHTLIHEASHKFLDTVDIAYVYQPRYAQMTPQEAFRNADSYAFTAASFYRRRVLHSDRDLN